MTNKTGPLLHWAEEYGQGRELTSQEVAAWVRLSFIIFAFVTVIAFFVINQIRLWSEIYLTWRSLIFDPLTVGALAAAIYFLGKFVPTLVENLRSERRAESYAPPQPAQLPALPAPGPPIVVKPYGGQPPYVLDRQEPLALPDGRQSGLTLNEPTIAAIIEEVLTQHGGLWSRKRLMSLKVAGQRITRAAYENLTSKLAHAGFLQERPTGGYRLPPDVQQFDDLATYFPNLATGKAGGQAGRREEGGLEADPPPGGAVRNLAERHRLAWLARQREEAEHGD